MKFISHSRKFIMKGAALVTRQALWTIFGLSLMATLVSVGLELGLHLNPCPLCILQRIAIIWVFAWSLLAICQSSTRLLGRGYAILIFCGLILGIVASGRQIWLQHLPADQVPACGPSFLYVLQVVPASKWFALIFQGSGECAIVGWRFLGISLPEWSLSVFLILLLLTIPLFFQKKGGRS